MAHTIKARFWRPLTLRQLQRVKTWHETRQLENSVEYQVWQIVLTLWLMSWVGWLPAFVFHAYWSCPLCIGGMLLPQSYVYVRAQAAAAQFMRCEWLSVLT